MIERDFEGAPRDGHGGTTMDTFLFIGTALTFSGALLRIVEQEAGGAHAMRLDEMRGMPEARVARNHQVHKVFFDDRAAGDVLHNFDEYKAAFPEADWILAYRSPAAARGLLVARSQTPRLQSILLLPMTLPIYLWTSMLRLVLAGQLVVEGDLIGTPSSGESQPSLPHDHRKVTASGVRDAQSLPESRLASDLRLTQREKEVLELVSQGGRNKSIANTMSLSEHTVKLHLHNAITKIGARNRTEAATWYLSHQSGERQ